MMQNQSSLLLARGSRAMGMTALLIGGGHLIAWLAGSAGQWSAAGLIIMKTNTALGLVLAGVALLLLSPSEPSRSRRAASAMPAALVLAIGGLTLSQHLFNYDLGIDQLLAREAPGAAATTSPNRMGPPGAIGLTLAGGALLALALGRRAVAPYLGLAVCVVVLAPAVGFLYGVETLYSQPRITAIAWPTVLGLLALGVGLVLTQHHTGPMALLLRDDPGGALLRRLLPAALLVPLLLGYLKIQGERYAVLDAPTRTAVLVLGATTLFSVLLWQSAARLSRAAAAQGKTQQALSESEQRLGLALTAGATGAWDWDMVADAATVSASYRDLFGVPKEVPFTYESWLAAVHPEDRERCHAYSQAFFNSPKAVEWNLEFRINTPHRGVRWHRAIGQIQRSDDGKPVRFIGVTTDVTERRHAEAERERVLGQFAAERHRLTAILRQLPSGVVIAEAPSGRIQYANEYVEQLFGPDYPREDASQDIDRWRPSYPDGRPLRPEEIPMLRALRGETVVGQEVRFPRRDRDGWVDLVVNAAPIRDINGRVVEAVATFLDITGRKRAESELQKLAQHRQLALDAAHMGWWHYDPATKTTSWDDRFKEIYGVSGHQRPTDEILARLHPEDLPVVRAKIEAALDPVNPQRYRAEYRIFHADGSVRWIEAHGAATFEGMGKARRATSFVGTVAEISERKRAEEILKQSELFYRQTLESIPGMVFTTRPDGYCDYQSQQWEDYTGVPVDEHLGQGWTKLLHPDDQPRAFAAWRSAVEGRAPYDLEYRVRRRDGAYEWFKVIGRPICAAAGQIVRWFGVALNIEELKQAEEALRQSQARERAFLEHLPVGVWFRNAQGQIIYGNPAAQQIWAGANCARLEDFGNYKGWRHGTGQPIPLEDWAGVRAVREGQITLEEVIDIECFDATRKTILNSAVPVRDAAGTIIGAVIFNQDITERKQTEQAVRENEARFRQLAESMPQLVWTANADGVVDYYNHQVRHYPGARVCENGAWEWQPMLHPDDVAPTAEHWQRAVREGIPYQIEHRVQTADGNYHWHLSRAYPSRDAKGNVVKWFGTATDIDDQKRAQEILEQKVQERTTKLRETVADLEQFSYSLAHDLRAPLRSMTCFSTFLLDEHQEQLDPEALDYLKRIASAAQRMDDLIRDVLTLSQVARADLTLAKVDLDQLARHIVQQYPNLQAEQAEIEILSPLRPVWGSVALVTQCVSNLLGNAVKFVAPGLKPKVTVWTETHEDRVRFFVRDNGIGIDAQQLQRIWRIFERAHDQKCYPGTGIGLSIVKRGAERMGGSVGVSSEPGLGSTFWVELAAA